MRIDAKAAEEAAIMNVAQEICVAVRTAPKARGIDQLTTCILNGQEKDTLADEMERLGHETGAAFFIRDAGNVRVSSAIVLIGSSYAVRGLNEMCGLCNQTNCRGCNETNSVCVYAPLDLGIAIGSAVSKAADARIDNRVLFSAGQAAVSLGIFAQDIKIVMGIPLCSSGKSPFFDRK